MARSSATSSITALNVIAVVLTADRHRRARLGTGARGAFVFSLNSESLLFEAINDIREHCFNFGANLRMLCQIVLQGRIHCVIHVDQVVQLEPLGRAVCEVNPESIGPGMNLRRLVFRD